MARPLGGKHLIFSYAEKFSFFTLVKSYLLVISFMNCAFGVVSKM